MAGRIPDSFIDDLLQRVDVVEVIGQRLQLKRTGSNYQALCPFHNEKTPSFTVSPGKQFYHCFGCGAHGTAIRFIMEYDRLEFRDAVELLAQRAGMEIPEEARSGKSEENGPLYSLLGKAAEAYQQWLRKHPARERAVAYLKKRGIDGEIAAHFGIGYAPEGWSNILDLLGQADELFRAGLLIRRDDKKSQYDRFRDRIMFPIHDRRGRVIGFGGRVLDQGEPKYLNSPETPVFHKGREVYGLFETLKHNPKPTYLVVVEGYMDVIALAQHGVHEAVATLGTAVTQHHVERLFQVTHDLVFCFDGDEAGRKAAWRALEQTLPAVREGRQARFLFLPQGEDPDSMVRHEGEQAFRKRLDQAEPLSEFFYRRIKTDLDLTTAEGRAALADKAAPLIRQVRPGAFREMLMEELADLTATPVDRLDRVVSGDSKAESVMPGRAARRAPPSEPANRLARTPQRLAVALLLQYPKLAALAGPANDYLEADAPGLDVFGFLLQQLAQSPELSSSALLERCRDQPFEGHLWKLAVWDHMVPEEGVEQEFRDALGRIERLREKQRLETLYEKLQSGDLTAEEMAEWKTLKR